MLPPSPPKPSRTDDRPGEPSGSSPSVKKAALVAVKSFHWAGTSDRGRLQRTPDGSPWYARYPLGRGRASFDFEHLTKPGVWDRYHGIARTG
jgi:hypothetical protein